MSRKASHGSFSIMRKISDKVIDPIEHANVGITHHDHISIAGLVIATVVGGKIAMLTKLVMRHDAPIDRE